MFTDYKKEIILTVSELKSMLKFFILWYRKDPKGLGRLIMGVILGLALLRSVRWI
jgi:hypothetical protein